MFRFSLLFRSSLQSAAAKTLFKAPAALRSIDQRKVSFPPVLREEVSPSALKNRPSRRQLVEQEILCSSLLAVNTTVSHCKHYNLVSAIAAAGVEIAQLGDVGGSRPPSQLPKIAVIEGFSTIKDLSQFAEFHDESDYVERVLAVATAAGCEGPVGIGVLPQQLQDRRDLSQLAEKLKDALRTFKTLVLVNAPNAAFADIIVLSQRHVTGVQVKSFKSGGPSLKHPWALLGTHRSTKDSKEALNNLLDSVCDKPEKVVRSFVVCLRTDSNIQPRWRDECAPEHEDEHFFVLQRKQPLNKESAYFLDVFHGPTTLPHRVFPLRDEFRGFVGTVSGPRQIELSELLLATKRGGKERRQRELNLIATDLSRRRAPLLKIAREAGAAIARLAGALPPSPPRDSQITILSEFSSIQSRDEFWFLGEDPYSQERLILTSIVEACGLPTYLCGLRYCLEPPRKGEEVQDPSIRQYFSELEAFVKSCFQRGQPCTFVFLNARPARFADIIVLTPQGITLVEVKNMEKGDNQGCNWFKKTWGKLNSCEHPAHKLIKAVFAEPQNVETNFVLCARVGCRAHLWVEWLRRYVASDTSDVNNRHMLLIRPKADEFAAFRNLGGEEFILESHSMSKYKKKF
uniref:Uncharacterized protein n=1 Tax=Chromera velia CCMP2878 TaxID=1169474 RepID=A0A0G4GB77_9ALVE|eukprot:Cvel_21110.t1-p1 / transcript=Cvel_21110.t1 / gene=Cvel_21110 / organism=Chromera_velia_CCMP2878 / gene_product=hypothetical protein / transcript_product=hypothetical protein / location=Cvel_scaffold1953:23722-25602(+) / protein_length=627 / sequence_SO=supercontig / SO=protein_coding / is_pseudo=false